MVYYIHSLQGIVEEFLTKHRDEVFNITIDKEEIKTAIRGLKNNKSVGYHGVSNENLKYAPEQVIDFLTTIYAKMINCQSMPKDFNICMLKPIIKDPSKSNSDVGNLRPVAISNVIGNLFETILLNRNHLDSDKQFGFKQHSSCNHAGYVL